MKVIAIVAIAGSILAAGAVAQPANTWQSHLLTTKYGPTFSTRSTTPDLGVGTSVIQPAIALNQAGPDNNGLVPSAIPWREQVFKAKYGRYSPLWESQHPAKLTSEDTAKLAIVPFSARNPRIPTRNAWLAQIMKIKYNR